MNNDSPSQPVLDNSEAFRIVPKTSESFRTVPHLAESFRTIPHPAERSENHTLTVREVARIFEQAHSEDTGRIKALEQEILDLKITNKAKDYFIEQLVQEQRGYVERLMSFSRQIGELKT